MELLHGMALMLVFLAQWKFSGDHPINIGDYQLRPAWKAVHIGLPM